jgi:hypothetical protein
VTKNLVNNSAPKTNPFQVNYEKVPASAFATTPDQSTARREWQLAGARFWRSSDSKWPADGLTRTAGFDPFLPVATGGYTASNIWSLNPIVRFVALRRQPTRGHLIDNAKSGISQCDHRHLR